MSSVKAPYCPDEGEFVWIDFNPQAGHEQAGRRPALVLSPAIYNKPARLCVVCPITNQVKNYPFTVPIPGGLLVTGAVLADQVKSLSWPVRNVALIGHAPPSLVAEVRGKLKALLRIL